MTPEPPRPAERRLVHVLFVDLVGFTSLVEDLDAEDVALLQEHYFSQVAGLVAAAGGQVEKYIGDAVLATFGLPVLRPDDAGAAVRAGLAVVASLAGLEARLGLPAGTLRARVGVHTGEVVVTWAADGTWRLSGDVVNAAARLQSAAEPGTVVVGPDTALAVEGTLDLVPLAGIALTGKAEPVPAWRVAGRRRGPAPDGGPFRGRAAARPTSPRSTPRTGAPAVPSGSPCVTGPSAHHPARVMPAAPWPGSVVRPTRWPAEHGWDHADRARG